MMVLDVDNLCEVIKQLFICLFPVSTRATAPLCPPSRPGQRRNTQRYCSTFFNGNHLKIKIKMRMVEYIHSFIKHTLINMRMVATGVFAPCIHVCRQKFAAKKYSSCKKQEYCRTHQYVQFSVSSNLYSGHSFCELQSGCCLYKQKRIY
jgi:hypothetical protein